MLLQSILVATILERISPNLKLFIFTMFTVEKPPFYSTTMFLVQTYGVQKTCYQKFQSCNILPSAFTNDSTHASPYSVSGIRWEICASHKHDI